jgi:hypothetical protein
MGKASAPIQKVEDNILRSPMLTLEGTENTRKRV